MKVKNSCWQLQSIAKIKIHTLLYLLPKIMLNRRAFLSYFSIGWLTSCFPMILAICDPGKTTAKATTNHDNLLIANKNIAKSVVNKKVNSFTVIGSTSELKKTGYLEAKGVSVLISPDLPNKLVAVNPKCTHNGCDVKWSTGEKKYECPCHGASFNANGAVLKGPATKPLATYPVKIVGTQVLVKI
jgi:cytochrome b6-f complex iron-sulfur subunit